MDAIRYTHQEMTRTVFRQSFLVLVALLFALPQNSLSDETVGQSQQYNDAAKACGNSKDASTASAAIWGVMGALCGYNCFNYFSLRAERTAVLAAASDALVAATHANTCVPGTSATVTGLVAAIKAAFGQAEAETANAQVAAAAPVSSAVTGSSAAVAHETMASETTTLVANQGANVTAVTAAQTGYCSNPYTAGQCANCGVAIANLTKSVTALNLALTPMITRMNAVISTGKFCQYGSFASAAADIGLAATVGKDVTQGLMGLAGAAPGLITLLVLDKTDTLSSTTSAMGKSSCWTAGLSLVLAGVKAMQANKSANCKDENERKAGDLANGAPVLDPAMSRRNPVNALGLVAPAKVAGPTGASSGLMSADSASLIQGASKVDPAIARLEAGAPGTIRDAIEQAASVFNVSPADFFRGGTLGNQKLATMISGPLPESVGEVSGLLAALDSRIGGMESQLAVSSPVGSGLMNSTTSAAIHAAGGGTAVGSPGNPLLNWGTDAPGPATGASQPGSARVIGNPNDEFHAGYPGTIFQIVSGRLGRTTDRLERLEWQLPTNRFQHGMSLQPEAKKKR
jgi:hypothetical protein